MIKRSCLLLLCCLFFHLAPAKNGTAAAPKLVVGIVIDQMKYDYLIQFRSHFGKGGFNRLLTEGTNCTAMNYNYIPTYTAPGHASIYTGSTPAVHGIVGNEWYDNLQKKVLYCVSDTTVFTVGTTNLTAGKMSPKNLLSTTITDELKQASNKKSKVIGIALKDRGAILPAGHEADAAYWFDGVSGNWITSSYYLQLLPKWVNDFNNQKQAQQFAKQDWNLLEPINNYLYAQLDSNSWESKFAFERNSAFPHRFSLSNLPNTELVRASPWGNTFTKNFAIAAIAGEQLGKGTTTDFLTISFSSTDYVGHQFGPNSLEIEDVYARLDKDLEELFTYLDQTFGKNNVLVFLTADHGVAPVPGFAAENHLPGGVANTALMLDSLKAYLNDKLGKADWIKAYENQQIYLNTSTLTALNLEKQYVIETIRNYFVQHPSTSVAAVYSLASPAGYSNSVYASFIQNGYNSSRCGDVLITYKPGWIENAQKGTTHGTFYTYDTYVPCLFWGWKIPAKSWNENVCINAIAPTLAQLLHLPVPSGATGKALLFSGK